MTRNAFISFVSAMAKESARSQRHSEVERRRQLREQEKRLRDRDRIERLSQKEARQRYIEERIAAAEDKTDELVKQEDLGDILAHTLSVNDSISFETLRMKTDHPPFAPPCEIAKPLSSPARENFFSSIEEPRGLKSLIPGAQSRYLKALREAEVNFESAMQKFKIAESHRQAKLKQIRSEL